MEVGSPKPSFANRLLMVTWVTQRAPALQLHSLGAPLPWREGCFQAHTMSLHLGTRRDVLHPVLLSWESQERAAPLWMEKAPKSQQKPFMLIPLPASW